jgi:GNAT superfamily N-acetyltransferase
MRDEELMDTQPNLPCTIRQLNSVTDREAQELAAVLIDCVHGGASVGFMTPLDLPKALAFWRRIAGEVEGGARVLLVAEQDGAIVGTVQVVLEQPENQPHRGDISKMLVHRRARQHGVGGLLMRAAEDAARANGKTLLVLDTASDAADRLYIRSGWTLVGTVPDFALWPEGGYCSTRFYYRRLD